jgi:probable rRNA maturation factor
MDTAIDVEVARSTRGQADDELLTRAVAAAVAAAQSDAGAPGWLSGAPPLQVSILLTDDAEIHRLNQQYRGVDRPTDVLSFAFVEGEQDVELARATGSGLALGQLVLSHEYCVRQAEELGHSMEMELAWLTIHGVLQLLGYAHEHDDEATRMEAVEYRALRSLGYEPP